MVGQSIEHSRAMHRWCMCRRQLDTYRTRHRCLCLQCRFLLCPMPSPTVCYTVYCILYAVSYCVLSHVLLFARPCPAVYYICCVPCHVLPSCVSYCALCRPTVRVICHVLLCPVPCPACDVPCPNTASPYRVLLCCDVTSYLSYAMSYSVLCRVLQCA
jgi:hypothetical protein